MSKSDLSPIEKSVREQMQRHFSGIAHPSFVIGVSGGMDSMALLHIFRRLQVPAVVCHINYQKRGSASDKDAELVAQVAEEWGFASDIRRVDPTEAEGQNFQHWARQVRYEQFRRLARKHAAEGIAVAHHEDDQVETILQKVFRGAGLASWSAMDIWDGEIFRPLLSFSRQQIEEYVRANNIPYRTDASNLDNDFARNLLRNEWLDRLQAFFPGWKQNVLRIEQQAENHRQALQWIANRISDSSGIEREAFNALEPGLQKALLLFLIKNEYPSPAISNESLDRVEELPNLQTGQTIELSPEVAVLRDRDRYVIEQKKADTFEPLTIERNALGQGAIQVEGMSLALTGFENPDYQENLYLDAQKLSWPVTVRRWREGDAFQPLGMEGHQQVAEHLTNRKVSAAHKKRALVIESFEERICAIIFPPIQNQTPPGTISEWAKCDSRTNSCLRITNRK